MMIAGFEAPTNGEIYILGRRMTRTPPHKRDIGFVFQNYALFPHMSVAENIAFPLFVRGMPAAERTTRVRQALEIVQLAGYEDRRPMQLSGGQQQRIALARALVFEPSLVLLDEPLGALDKQLRDQLKYELKQIHSQLGVTMIYVTHDQTEALTMADRVAVFNGGVVQQLAEPRTLYDRPANAFVASFVGENNQLTGPVLDVEDSFCTVQLQNGLTIRARIENPIPKGAETLVFLRPEHILIEPRGAAADRTADAVIRNVEFFGDHVRLRFDIASAVELVAKTTLLDLVARLNVGDTIRVGWLDAQARAFAKI
jgi:putative spermidine/putrescine transport system ATP-binding protein